MREQGRSETGIASLPRVKLAPMSAPGPTRERQEHLDCSHLLRWRGAEEASVSRSRQWAIGDLPEESRS